MYSAGLNTEMRPFNQNKLQKDIEEEIGSPEDSYTNNQNAMDGGYSRGKDEIDPNDTCTSEFYQVPIQGGIPVQLTFENGRRPFTPPFAQLVRVPKPPSGLSNKRPPIFVNSAAAKAVMTNT